MPHVDRRQEPLYEYMQRTIDVGQAARVIRNVLHGAEVRPQQERVALAVYMKTVPALAAIQVQVHDKQPDSIHDLNALLLTSGVDPADVWRTLEGEAEAIESAEKVDSA